MATQQREMDSGVFHHLKSYVNVVLNDDLKVTTNGKDGYFTNSHYLLVRAICLAEKGPVILVFPVLREELVLVQVFLFSLSSIAIPPKALLAYRSIIRQSHATSADMTKSLIVRLLPKKRFKEWRNASMVMAVL